MEIWSEEKMLNSSEKYLNILERFAMVSVDLVEKGLTSEEELAPVYDYILEEMEALVLKKQVATS